MSSDAHKACPKCYFDNLITASTCEFCGWQLLDEQGEETVFMGTSLAGDFGENFAEELETDLGEEPEQESVTQTTVLESQFDTQLETQFEPNSNNANPAPANPARPKTFNLAGNLAHFEVQQIIGKGGMGAVYKAQDQTLERHVAIKVLRQHRGLDQAGKDLLLEEARTICKLSHPNIVTVFDIARGTDNNFIIMEWIEGETLDKLIPADGMDLTTALNYASQIVQGLVHAHQHHIIHSDIKPQNIMHTPEDGIKILDFGIAGLLEKQAQQLPAESSSNTQSNSQKQTSSKTRGFTGTPGYASPEQALGKSNLDERSDIFAFGIVFYQLLTGKRPFDGKTAKEKTAAILTGDYPALPSKIPQDIRAIVEHCLKLSPKDRYQSSAELEDDLQRFQNGNPVSVINSKSYWLKKKTVKHKWPVLLVTLAAFAGVAQLTWQQVQSAQQSQREQLLTRFTRQVENLEANVQLTRMSPAHDTTASQQAWQASIAEIQQQIPQLGDIAKGPGNYATGRMFYVLQDYENALQHLQSAWDAGFTEDRTAYYLALTHSALYQQQYAIIQNLDSNSAKRDRLEVLDAKHKQPAINYLQQGMSDSPFQAYAQALLTFYQGNNQQALEMLQNLTDTPAWFYEHHILRGDILLNQADFHGSQGEQEKSNELAQQALHSYELARALGRSDLQVQLKPLSVFNRLITDALYGDGENIPELLENAKSYLDQAQVIAPTDYRVPFNQGLVLGHKSNYEKWFIGDPIKTQDMMIKALENALELSPQNPDILLNLGLAYARKLGTLNERDISDPNLLGKATEAFNSISADKRDYFYFNSLGIFLSEQAVYESAGMKLFDGSLKKLEESESQAKSLFFSAVDTLKKAMALKPERLGSVINLGSLYIQWANESSLQSANQSLQKAVETFDSLLKNNPEHFVVHYYLGMVYRTLSRSNNFLLIDSQQSLELAKQHLDKAEELQSEHPYVANETMLWYADHAEFLWQSGQNPSTVLQNGISYAEKALSIHPDNSLIALNNNLNWLQVYMISFFSPHLDLPQYTKIDIQKMSTTPPPILEVFPELLSGDVSQIRPEELQQHEFPGDFNLIMAEYASLSGNFKEAEARYNEVHEEHMGKALHLLFQRQNYQRWLKGLSGNKKDENQNEVEEVTNKLAHIEQLLEQHFSELWKQIKSYEETRKLNPRA